MNLAKEGPQKKQAQKQQRVDGIKFGQNKITESYHSYFHRNMHEGNEYSPSQSTHTNIHERPKNRLKANRSKDTNGKCSYFELESTLANESQVLRQQNIQLKKIIAELKLSQFYQIDQNKIKNLLLELDDLKKQFKKIKQENQKLRIQNDFYKRANFQLKLQTNKLKNICGNVEVKQQYMNKPLKRPVTKQKKQSFRMEENYELAECFSPKEKHSENQSNKQQIPRLKSSIMGMSNQKMSLSRQKVSTIRRLKSQRHLYPRIVQSHSRTEHQH